MSPVVIAWVVLSGFGLILSSYLTFESWLDMRALGESANGRLLAARSRFGREGIRVTVHWVWLLMGVTLLLEVPLGPKLVLGLLYGNVALVTNSLIDARARSLILVTRDSTRPETPIEREDREVGDVRRALQSENEPPPDGAT